MTPRAVLTAAGIPVDRIAACLPALDLETVSLREAPGWLTRLWTDGTQAMALPRVIYLSPDRFGAEPSTLGPLLVHELVHVAQWASLGVLTFLWQYVRDYAGGRLQGLSHSAAYRAVALEAEARRLTATLT